jgi:hypothetical protein
MTQPKTITLGKALDKIRHLQTKGEELACKAQDAAQAAKSKAVGEKIVQLEKDRPSLAAEAGQNAYNASKRQTKADIRKTRELLAPEDQATLRGIMPAAFDDEDPAPETQPAPPEEEESEDEEDVDEDDQ